MSPPRTIAAVAVALFVPLLAVGQTREEKVAKYQKTLQTSKDSKARVEAIKELAELGQLSVNFAKPIIPDLMKALKDTDAKVRAAAAHAVGQVDPEDKKGVVEELVRLLKEDKEDDVRGGAARGLGALGAAAREAVPALREAQKRTNDKRSAKTFQAAIIAIRGKKK